MNALRARIDSASAWTIFIFGALALILGAAGLIWPNVVLLQLGFEIVPQEARPTFDYTTVFIMASSMASFNMGVYYILAALSGLRQFFGWTVPFRCLTFVVFTLSVVAGYAPPRFMTVALWELAGAVATGIALYAERQRGRSFSAD